MKLYFRGYRLIFCYELLIIEQVKDKKRGVFMNYESVLVMAPSLSKEEQKKKTSEGKRDSQTV